MILSVLKIFFNLVGNTDIKSTEVKHHKLWNEKFNFKGITHTHTHTHTHTRFELWYHLSNVSAVFLVSEGICLKKS